MERCAELIQLSFAASEPAVEFVFEGGRSEHLILIHSLQYSDCVCGETDLKQNDLSNRLTGKGVLMRFLLYTAGVSLVFGVIANAQEVQRFSFDVGGGFTEPLGNTGRNLDIGWNVGAGAGFNFSQYVGAMIDVNYNRFGINGSTLNAVGFPGGDVGIFSATLDPIVHLTPHGRFDLYVIGGGGMYRQNQEFTAPTIAGITGFDPFFGFYTAAVPSTQVLASNSVVKPGVDGGLGVAFGTKWHGEFFAEARYNRIFMNNNQHTDFLPVTFGFRW